MQEIYSPARVSAEKRNRRYHQLRMMVPILLLLVVVNALSEMDIILNPILDFDYICLAAMLLVTAVLVHSMVNWNCPHCHKNLSFKWNPKNCPKCGQLLH